MKKASDFQSKQEFLAYLIANKEQIISQKKSVLKFADPFSLKEDGNQIIKALSTSYKDDVPSGKITRTIIGNTYLWLDSHDDVHIPGIFTESISKDRAWHLHDHEYKITSKVGTPKSIYEKTVAWSDLLHGNKKGNTTALFMDSEISKELNPLIFTSYLNGEIDQHSVGMRYIDISLAINDKNIPSEYEVWNKYIDSIGNKDKAEKQGYFWAVEKASLVEISCVLEGSNELTPTIDNIEKSIQKQICPGCGANVTPDNDGCCPSCDADMKGKTKANFYSMFANAVAK